MNTNGFVGNCRAEFTTYSHRDTVTVILFDYRHNYCNEEMGIVNRVIDQQFKPLVILTPKTQNRCGSVPLIPWADPGEAPKE